MRLKWAFWDILGKFGRLLTSLDHLDCFHSHFRPFSSMIGSFKKSRDGPMDRRTHGRTDGHSYRDAWTHPITDVHTQSVHILLTNKETKLNCFKVVQLCSDKVVFRPYY